jgi:hypothetical protein
VTQCVDCDPGKHCNNTGLYQPTGDCDPGFYCPGGVDVSNPIATPCPIGLHCPQGSGQPVPCPPGTFTNYTQAATCDICPAGFYCVPEEVVAGKICCMMTALWRITWLVQWIKPQICRSIVE